MLRRAFLASAAAAPLAAAEARTTAQQLGYPATAKLLMVHADDAGMCHSVNLATIEALEKQAVASSSIMTPCPWVGEFAAWARAHTDADLGLHLTLTSEWKHYRWGPVAPREKVKGLLDPEGYLHRDVAGVARNASAEEVALELRAQIEKARRLGIRFTHLDTHMGTLFARPDYFEVYTQVAREAGAPCMIPRPTPELIAGAGLSPAAAQSMERKAAEGFVLLDHLATGVPGRTVEERKASYERFLRELKPGVTMLIVHLAQDDPEIRGVTSNWMQRYADLRFFTSTAARELIASLGVRPVTFRELGKLAYRKP